MFRLSALWEQRLSETVSSSVSAGFLTASGKYKFHYERRYPDGTTAWNFLHAADALLYRAKNKSRNSIMLGHVLGDDDEKPWEG